MNKTLLALLLSTFLSVPAMAQNQMEIELIGTTDVHGAFFQHNYLSGRDTKSGMSRVMAFLRAERQRLGCGNVLYLDNGDILQGQPTAYFYNYEDTLSEHLAASILNYMGCSVGNFGNHDVETGHAVYDRWTKDCRFPLLGANVVDVRTGEPYLKPYEILECGGLKIAVLGMNTPAIPCWLPENLWSGLRFDDMEASCRKWVPIILEREKPDLLVGIFHAGQGGGQLDNIVENASDIVAQEVPGIDIIFFGHDHKKECRSITNRVSGKNVLMLNASNRAFHVAVANIVVTKDAKGRVVKKDVTGHLESMAGYEPDAEFVKTFAPQEEAVKKYVDEKIGQITNTISCSTALQGPCAFMELIHRMQLEVSDNARISIAAPLSMSAEIKQGDITIRDMFNLYKYENLLYTMRLTGREVKNLLEMSYAMWTKKEGVSFNYDSAFGIDYTVDPGKPQGEMVDIKSFSDGTPFNLDQEYRVAINSYRGNGGGDLLTRGAGISKKELSKRIISSTDKDLRYYLIQHIRQQKTVEPVCTSNWHFVPEDWGEKNMSVGVEQH